MMKAKARRVRMRRGLPCSRRGVYILKVESTRFENGKLGPVSALRVGPTAVSTATILTRQDDAVGRHAVTLSVLRNFDTLGGIEVVETSAVGKNDRVGDSVNKTSNIDDGKNGDKQANDPPELGVNVLLTVPAVHEDDGDQENNKSDGNNKVRVDRVNETLDDAGKNGCGRQKSKANNAEVEESLLC